MAALPQASGQIFGGEFVGQGREGFQLWGWLDRGGGFPCCFKGALERAVQDEDRSGATLAEVSCGLAHIGASEVGQGPVEVLGHARFRGAR